jgi:hypothetical protein
MSQPVSRGLLVPVFAGMFMALLDLSIVTVARPAMLASLHTTCRALTARHLPEASAQRIAAITVTAHGA